MKIIILIITLGFSLNIKAEISDPNSLFLEANKFYDSSNYTEALKLYNVLLEEKYLSPELYFNVGNCYYKKDKFAKAILYFEKAKKIAPNKNYVLKNISLAQTKITDSPERSRMGVASWLASFFGFTTDFWAWISILCLVVALVSFVVFKRTFKPLLKNIAKIKFYSFSFLFLAFVLVSAIKYNAETNSNTAIVMEPSVTLKTKPDRTAESAFVIHSGSKIVILNAQNNWSEVRFGSNVGWLEDDFIEKI